MLRLRRPARPGLALVSGPVGVLPYHSSSSSSIPGSCPCPTLLPCHALLAGHPGGMDLDVLGGPW